MNRRKNNKNYNRELCNWDLNSFDNNYYNYNREFCDWDWNWNRFINNADYAFTRILINCFINQYDSWQRQQYLPVKRYNYSNRGTAVGEPKRAGKGKKAITAQQNTKSKSKVNKPNQVAKTAAAKNLNDTVSSQALRVLPKPEQKAGKGKQSITVEPQKNTKSTSKVDKPNQVAKTAAAKNLNDTVSSQALWVLPKQEQKAGNRKQSVTVEPQQNTKSTSRVDKPNQVAKTAAAKNLSDIITSQDLKVMAKLFRDDIEFLQQRIAAEAAQHNTQSCEKLIIAKIFMTNGQLIAQQSFEFICSEIVGWIGKYQHEQLDTPIFYSVANNETHITIVCENMHAYECLGNCVREIKQQRTIAPITVLRLPPTLIYCYKVVYSDIISDEQLFLTQVQLHKAELRADRWIVVSHEVYSATGETHLTLLVNERSALLLTYHYNNKLYICLQTANFTNEGPLPLNV